MRRTLSLLAIGALVLMPARGHAGDSIGEKAEDVIRGIGRGFRDAAHDVKQAVVGRDVEVSVGETHMEMPTTGQQHILKYSRQRLKALSAPTFHVPCGLERSVRARVAAWKPPPKRRR